MLNLRTLTKEAYIPCPFHDDRSPSLAVYEDHGYCYGCNRYVRRYAMAALLMGLWDGSGDELAAVRRLEGKLLASGSQERQPVLPHPHPPSSSAGDGKVESSLPDTFHRYLLACPSTLAYFMAWRGFTIDTIRKFKLGWTGSHFTIPVYGVEGELRTVRYRAHPASVGEPKYSGVSGTNASQLFSLPHAARDTERLFVVEGEYDWIAGDQLGASAITTTNGASSLSKLPDLWLRLSVQVGQWVLATDCDEAGEQAAFELAKKLPCVVRARWSAGKGLNDYLLSGGDLESIEYERVTFKSFHF